MSASITRLHAAPTSSATASRGLREILGRVVSLWTAVLHRRDVVRLLDLDDRQLRDIGLIRNDVLGALAEPITHDPSHVLLDRSTDRMSRVRALASAPRGGV